LNGFVFFTNNCSLATDYKAGTECKLIYQVKMDGTDLCPVLHGTPSVSALVAYEDVNGNIELYWNDANKIRNGLAWHSLALYKLYYIL